MWMQGQINGLTMSSRNTFRIMPAVESPMPSSQFPVDIPHTVDPFVFPQNKYIGLHGIVAKGRGLPHKFFNYEFMILSKHGGNHIPFRRKFEEPEKIGLRFKEVR